MAEERQQARERVHRLEQELFELDEQIKATEGHRIQAKIRGLGSSYCVFESNYRWLVKALNYFGREEVLMELWKEDNRAKLESFTDEVTRLLHNFLAGAKSLVDHTRVFNDHMYEGHGFKKIYQEKVDRDLKHSPIVCFVQTSATTCFTSSFPSLLRH
jgi:1,4-alpha-glucan branching enzyme